MDFLDGLDTQLLSSNPYYGYDDAGVINPTHPKFIYDIKAGHSVAGYTNYAVTEQQLEKAKAAYRNLEWQKAQLALVVMNDNQIFVHYDPNDPNPENFDVNGLTCIPCSKLSWLKSMQQAKVCICERYHKEIKRTKRVTSKFQLESDSLSVTMSDLRQMIVFDKLGLYNFTSSGHIRPFTKSGLYGYGFGTSVPCVAIQGLRLENNERLNLIVKHSFYDTFSQKDALYYLAQHLIRCRKPNITLAENGMEVKLISLDPIVIGIGFKYYDLVSVEEVVEEVETTTFPSESLLIPISDILYKASLYDIRRVHDLNSYNDYFHHRFSKVWWKNYLLNFKNLQHC